VSGFKNKPSFIINGPYKGMSLYEFYKTHKSFFCGCKSSIYPLLVKILDCNDKLSVQVHPKSGKNQKNEA
jgi:mannose-6-phosphate isomerase